LPLVEDADVIVCGAGPAGIAAAITAARAGAKVRVFEWRGCLGGVWTAGLLGYLLDFDKPGFNQELLKRLDERDMRRGTSKGNVVYEPEGMKLLLEEMFVEAGVKFQLHTRVSGGISRRETTHDDRDGVKSRADRRGGRRFHRHDGRWRSRGTRGMQFRVWRGGLLPVPADVAQCAARLQRRGGIAAFHSWLRSQPGRRHRQRRVFEGDPAWGHFPSYSKPTLWQVRDNLLLVMMNHQYGVPCFDAAKITEATVQARAELHKIVNGLRKLGGPWEGLQIAATAEQIGVRDGRRIAGRYTVNKDDLIAGARYDDAVVRPTFPVDIHALSKEANKTAAYSNAGVKVKPYDVPLRALIAKDVDGLMMAGRNISGDFIAHASYRVTGNSVAMGEAAGVTAALAAATKRMPHEVPWSEGEAKLKALGQRV
jgi:hypothetical protein